MSTPTDLYQQALALDPTQRAELAHLLLSSLDAPPRDPGWEEAWREEIERRLESIDRGEVELSDWQETMARLHKSLERGSST
jgi:putative addiction module component (TIGR02574 family)